MATSSTADQLLSGFSKANLLTPLVSAADGDHSKFVSNKINAVLNISSPLQANGKRRKMMKTESTTNDNNIIAATFIDTDVHQGELDKNKLHAEQFFLHLHPFSDLTLIVQGKTLYVDKGVLAAGSNVFRSYFEDENIESIEILDISPNEMIELLQFIYPQFQCTINNQNITVLLILAHRFELHLIADACRAFILLYLSKLQHVSTSHHNDQLIDQEDGSRVSISAILGILCTWFREFLFINDTQALEALLVVLAPCRISSFHNLDDFLNLEFKIRCKLFQARAKYLKKEQTRTIVLK